MNFQKLWNCGSLFGIHTSAVLVNQWPPNRIFCLLLDGNSEICITFLIFHRTWYLTTAVFCFEQKKTNNISVVSSHFHLYLRISALRLPTVHMEKVCRVLNPEAQFVNCALNELINEFHPFFMLTPAVLLRSRSNSAVTYLGSGFRPSLLMVDTAR